MVSQGAGPTARDDATSAFDEELLLVAPADPGVPSHSRCRVTRDHVTPRSSFGRRPEGKYLPAAADIVLQLEGNFQAPLGDLGQIDRSFPCSAARGACPAALSATLIIAVGCPGLGEGLCEGPDSRRLEGSPARQRSRRNVSEDVDSRKGHNLLQQS
jgi:hypothetical protein